MLVSSLVVVVVGEKMVGGSAVVFRFLLITSIIKANWIVETSSDKLSLSTFVFTFTRESYEGKRVELFNLDPSFLTRHTFWSQVKIIATS